MLTRQIQDDERMSLQNQTNVKKSLVDRGKSGEKKSNASREWWSNAKPSLIVTSPSSYHRETIGEGGLVLIRLMQNHNQIYAKQQ